MVMVIWCRFVVCCCCCWLGDGGGSVGSAVVVAVYMRTGITSAGIEGGDWGRGVRSGEGRGHASSSQGVV